jgi:hypothetical protein
MELLALQIRNFPLFAWIDPVIEEDQIFLLSRQNIHKAQKSKNRLLFPDKTGKNRLKEISGREGI